MRFDIVTIFPDSVSSYLEYGMVGRALESGEVKVNTHDLRKWTSDKHKTVDDSAYGGGAGMVMMVDPIYRAINEIKNKNKVKKQKVVLLSAKGKKWNQQLANEYSKLDNVIFVCGRYEGVDERVSEFVDEEISIGDYVLTGGELGSIVMIDSITRLLPGVLGNAESAKDESHSDKGVLEYPQYTRPEVFRADDKEYKVPEVLLSGNHEKIQKWRESSKQQIADSD